MRAARRNEIAPAQLLERIHQRRLRSDPSAIFCDDLGARAVAADDEWIA
jgi:hypothetical protein